MMDFILLVFSVWFLFALCAVAGAIGSALSPYNRGQKMRPLPTHSKRLTSEEEKLAIEKIKKMIFDRNAERR